MKDKNDKTSEGLNQIFEIINAKGDTGELKEIVVEENDSSENNPSTTSSDQPKDLDSVLGHFLCVLWINQRDNVDTYMRFVDKSLEKVDNFNWIVDT